MMLNNQLYNFYAQLVQESKSCKRIMMYVEEAGDDDQRDFWKTMLEQKHENIASLRTMIKAYESEICEDDSCGCGC